MNKCLLFTLFTVKRKFVYLVENAAMSALWGLM